MGNPYGLAFLHSLEGFFLSKLYMFQLLLFLIMFVVIYFVSKKYPKNDVKDGFISSKLNGTNLNESDALILSPISHFDLPQKNVYIGKGFRGEMCVTPDMEFMKFRYPLFTPGKLHSVTFVDRISQITGHIHPPLCPT